MESPKNIDTNTITIRNLWSRILRLETRFKEFENTDDFTKKHEYQGIVLHFVQNREWKYQYLPLDFPQ